jgi:hypothetical protein
MKRCEDCRHLDPDTLHPYCTKFFIKEENMVAMITCWASRQEEQLCGPDARYFEPTFWARVKGWLRRNRK